jgi:hypothetical protein
MTFSNPQEGKQVCWENPADLRAHERTIALFIASPLKLVLKELGRVL